MRSTRTARRLLGVGLAAGLAVCATYARAESDAPPASDYPARLEASIATLASDPSPANRARAAFGLFPGKTEGAWAKNKKLAAQAAEALRGAIRDDADPTVRLVAAWTLGYATGDAEVAPQLMDAVRQQEASGGTFSFGIAELGAPSFFWSFRSIGERGGAALRTFLLERLASPDPMIRMAAASCFERAWRRDAEVDQALHKAVQASTSDVQRHLAAVLAERLPE